MKSTIIPAIIPQLAQQKFVKAKKKYMPVYIYGASGFGKTTIVKEYLKNQKYYYIAENDFSSIPDPHKAEKKSPICVVIDDMHKIKSIQIQKKVLELLPREDLWVFMISRAPIPGWLSTQAVKCDVLVVNEKELHLTAPDIRRIFEDNHISASEEQLQKIVEITEGNGFGVRSVLLKFLAGEVFDETLAEEMIRLFSQNVEENCLVELDEDVLEFLVHISVVDSFTLELAEGITGNSRISSVIQSAMEAGNFMLQRDGEYFLRQYFLIALRNYVRKRYGVSYINEYYLNAGLFFELHDDIKNALKMYEACGNQNRMRSLLIRNARQNPTVAFQPELIPYYLNLKEDEVCDSTILMSGLSMLYSILLQPEKSEYWYNKLDEYSQTASKGKRKEAMTQLTYLDIGLPHRGTANLITVFKHVYQKILLRDYQLPEFSATSSNPSVMNGGKDFSDWSKHDVELASSIGKAVSIVLGKTGKGIVNLSLGESFFEKATDDFAAFNHLSKAHLETELGGKIEMQFAVVGVQVRMSLVHGDAMIAAEYVESFRKKIDYSKNHALVRNVEALSCRVALFENDAQKIERWFEEAPDENEVFFIAERYRYMTKIRCYIRKSQYDKAQSLLERMMYYAQQYQRPYLVMESRMLLSIVHRRMGLEWEKEFQEMLDQAYEYHFVRILSQEGGIVIPLMKEFQNRYRSADEKKQLWFKNVISETEKVMGYYPAYLDAGTVTCNDFSENAIEILKLQGKGMTARQIAQKLGIAEVTVKYHTTENYRKLNVKGKTEAVQKARNLRII